MSEFAIPLRLTSPLTHGQHVKDAQWLMAGNSRFEGLATLKDSAVDGVFGTVSASAAARTKYWLGYPEGSLDRTFGQTLYEYLRPNQWRPLPAAYRDRREARLRAAIETPGAKALGEAVRHLGYAESPRYSNRTMFGEWYRMNGQPWCAIFASYCFAATGYERFRYSYVPDIYDDAVHARNGLRVVWTPKPGDLALFDWVGERLAHVAFVRVPPSGGYFQDLGGNTGGTDLANGGEVASHTRSTSLVHAYVRVG